MLRAQGSGMTFIKTDWEYGKQYYYYIDANDAMQRIIAFNDTLPGMFEWWDAIDKWVPIQTDRQHTFEMLFDGGQPVSIKNTNPFGSFSAVLDSMFLTPYTGNAGIDTTFSAIFSWDDTLGGALNIGVIGAAGDSTIFIRSGAPLHTDTTGGHEIWGVIDFELPDTTNGIVNIGLVEPTGFKLTGATDGIYLRKNNASNKLMAWRVRNSAVDSLTLVTNSALNTRYRIGIYDDGRGITEFYVDGTRIGTLDQYSPWDEDLTFGILFGTSTARLIKTGRLYYCRIKQNLN